MSNIFKFPEFGARMWPGAASMVRAAALANGFPPSAADWMCEDLKPRYEAVLRIHEKLSAIEQRGAPDGGWQIANEVAEIYQEAMTQCLAQLIVVECELWLAKFGSDGDKLMKGAEKTNAHRPG